MNLKEVREADEEASRNTAPVGRRPRRDAARNRERLLGAARRLLGQGAGVSARELAREADLSVATLYRHFPTLDDLITAVYTDQTLACDAAVRRAVDDPDPARGVRTYFEDAFAVQAADPHFVAVFRRAMASSPDSGRRRERFRRDLASLVGRAREEGVVRSDLTVSDVLLILAANSGVTATRREDRQAVSRRLADIVFAGIGLRHG
ncbi:TetR family transcriptional regulator [Planotetraspora thailandica]|uniref:TetR family transcriptional regulator n=1 Tax=Planotetraspora thailandica TaxID=487172 RepID=A0A8J3Y1I7_9ACTN|nr:TetR/AcrR family transcriptional regulator [Planotetraspora thailandica]GII59035.1 TetR family transcriptional regulator [Planotetraspora thailandica]